MRHLSKGLLAALALPLAATTAEAQKGGSKPHAPAAVGTVRSAPAQTAGVRTGGVAPAYGGYYGGGYGGGYYPGGYGYAIPRNTYGLNISPYGVGFGYGYNSRNVGVGISIGTPFYGSGFGYGGYGYGYRPYYGGYYGGFGPYYGRYWGGYPYGLNSWSFAVPYSYPVVYAAPATAALVGSAIPVVPADSPPPAEPAQPAPANPNAAYVEVRVPTDAQVWLGPTPSDQTGPVRTFVSPPLETGYDYSYTVRARWTENGVPVTRERKVPVHAGDRLSIDMTRPQ
jgi:uncharacterized protein (TIGR03000 family)